ncbi:MAG: ATP-binding protein [Bacteroidales bacterium]|nr:ATP-binding protein [Bacteroidales bacterium]
MNWFEDSYLFFPVPRFSWSVRSVMVSPRKIYTIDTAFARSNSLSFSHDTGRLFENSIFLHLVRKGRTISYFRQKYECDFIVHQSNAPVLVLQVCSDLNPDNKDREINGLLEAMDFINHKEGIIVTLDQEDEFSVGNRKIKVVPSWKWLESV